LGLWRGRPGLCANTIVDQATGACIEASSQPTLGSLFPLSNSLFPAGTGDVGIGTTTPAAAMHLFRNNQIGQLLIEAAGANHGEANLKLKTGTCPNGWQIFLDDVAGGYNNLGAADRLGIFGGGAVRMAFDGGTGNVGIGTTNPTAALHVVRNNQFTGVTIEATGANHGEANIHFKTQSCPAGWQVFMDDAASGYNNLGAADRLGFFANGAVRMVLEGSTGNVGVGTTAPTAKLDVAGETATNTLRIRGGGDLVERFSAASGTLEPGTVVSLDPEHAGEVIASACAYDKKVIGVVSGAAGVNPGLSLSQVGVLDGNTQVAMVGRVYVKCSAENGSIEPGDLLTPATTAGYAMKATESNRSFGAVIGKAAGALIRGTGLVLVVVNLQ